MKVLDMLALIGLVTVGCYVGKAAIAVNNAVKEVKAEKKSGKINKKEKEP